MKTFNELNEMKELEGYGVTHKPTQRIIAKVINDEITKNASLPIEKNIAEALSLNNLDIVDSLISSYEKVVRDTVVKKENGFVSEDWWDVLAFFLDYMKENELTLVQLEEMLKKHKIVISYDENYVYVVNFR